MDPYWLIGLHSNGSTKTAEELTKRVGVMLSSTGAANKMPASALSRVLDYLHHIRNRCGENGFENASEINAVGSTYWHDIPLSVNLIDVDTPYGFLSEHGIYPQVSFFSPCVSGTEKELVINITQSFFERVLKKHCWLNILAQIIFHEVSVKMAGQHPLMALLEEHRYNSFQTTCDILSDRIRDFLESCACHCDPSLFGSFIENTFNLGDEISRQYKNITSEDDLVRARALIGRMVQEAQTLLRFCRIEDYSTGTVLGLIPSDIIHEQHRTELNILDIPSFYTPPYLADRLYTVLEDMGYTGENESGVRIIRNIIAYKESEHAGNNDGLLENIRGWVDLFLDFSEKNIAGLSLIKSGIMEEGDVAEIRSIITSLIEIHGRISNENSSGYTQRLGTILEEQFSDVSLGFSLNKLINEIHQDVLKNVFGVFKGWKSMLGQVDTASNKAVGITIDHTGTIEYFPANKVNVIDYSGDFRDGTSVVARTILLAYLSTNIHLRDNCYMDCISHTDKAWFFVDLGVHGASIFVDLDPNKKTISASYAESAVEDGNMARLRFIEDFLTELGFRIERTDITVNARLDELSTGMLDADEIVRLSIWTIQAFASVADFDQEIEDGRISNRSLKYHQQRISASGTGYPLYKITKGVRELERLSASQKEVNIKILSILNSELDRLGLERIPENNLGAKTIETLFNNIINTGVAEGKYLSQISDPLFPNPSYACPDPGPYFTNNSLDETYLKEAARIVNILDRVIGSSFAATADGNRITHTQVDILSGKISFYAVRDENTYRALQAFAVDGRQLWTTSGIDNIIRDHSAITSMLSKHGYHIEAIAGRKGWSSPSAPMVKGISIPAIRSCTGIATGILKKNRPDSVPADFLHAIFSDSILTPQEIGRLKDASGFITTHDSTLSHAQLTARTFNIPGMIIRGAQWVGQDSSYLLQVPAGAGSYLLKEGQVVTVDAVRGMMNIVGASTDEAMDASDVIQRIFSLLIKLNDSVQVEHSLKQLQALIYETHDVEVLKFIIQELFITETLAASIHKTDVMRYILDKSPDDVSSAIEEYIKDIILDHRRSFANDYEIAKHKLHATQDVHEALFVRKKMQAQLSIFKDMENMVCGRIGLSPASYDTQRAEIDELYRKKAGKFMAYALNFIQDLGHNPADHGINDQEKALRLFQRISILPGYDTAKSELDLLKNEFMHPIENLRKQFRESGENHVVDIVRCSSIFSDYVGNKAAMIAEMKKTMDELNVPPGFVLTSIGVTALIEHNAKMVSQIEAVLRENQDATPQCLQKVLSIAAAFNYPPCLKNDIVSSYHQLESPLEKEDKLAEISRLFDLASTESLPPPPCPLNTICSSTDTIGEIISRMDMDKPDKDILLSAYETGGGVFVVVRSSSVLEDTYEKMMAGRFKSYPYVRGEKILLEAILKCLAYYWVEIGEVGDTQPVLIHHQIKSDVSMVINSVNLADHRWDEVVINSARGAGAGLVSGRVESDLYFVDAASFALKREVSTTKHTKTIFNEQKGYDTITAPIEAQSERIRPSLSENDASRVAQLARKIHDLVSYPVDIEAVMHNGSIHIVQVRPMVLP